MMSQKLVQSGAFSFYLSSTVQQHASQPPPRLQLLPPPMLTADPQDGDDTSALVLGGVDSTYYSGDPRPVIPG
jgi:hypothetical protein